MENGEAFQAGLLLKEIKGLCSRLKMVVGYTDGTYEHYSSLRGCLGLNPDIIKWLNDYDKAHSDGKECKTVVL